MKKHTLNSISHLKSVKVLDAKQNNIVGGSRQGEGFIPPPSNNVKEKEKGKGGSNS